MLNYTQLAAMKNWLTTKHPRFCDRKSFVFYTFLNKPHSLFGSAEHNRVYKIDSRMQINK